MIDLSKFSPRQLLAIILTMGILIMIFCLSLIMTSAITDRPFLIYGQEFGFNASTIEKRAEGLKQCNAELTKTLADFSEEIKSNSKEKFDLKEQNEKLTVELNKYRNHDRTLWFPIEDVSFQREGFFEEQNSKSRKQGTWSNADSELTLKALGRTNDEITLETNLPPPSNRIRLKIGDIIVIPMQAWEYRVTLLQTIYDQEAYVRIDRRAKI